MDQIGPITFRRVSKTQMALRTTISPAKVQYPQISQLQISSSPEATSQTVPHSPWCRYISDVLVPFQNKTQNNKNWTFCVEHEQFSQDICLNPDLWLTWKKKSTQSQQRNVWEESDESDYVSLPGYHETYEAVVYSEDHNESEQTGWNCVLLWKRRL